jgi:hypothetical protein
MKKFASYKCTQSTGFAGSGSSLGMKQLTVVIYAVFRIAAQSRAVVGVEERAQNSIAIDSISAWSGSIRGMV